MYFLRKIGAFKQWDVTRIDLIYIDYFKSFGVALHDNLVKKASVPYKISFTWIKCFANQLAARSAYFYSLPIGYLTASKVLMQFNVLISDLEENTSLCW